MPVQSSTSLRRQEHSQPHGRHAQSLPSKAEAKIALLEIENARASQPPSNSRAVSSATWKRSSGTQSGPSSRSSKSLRQTVAAQRASIGEWQVKFEDLNRAHQGALRKIRQMEGK